MPQFRMLKYQLFYVVYLIDNPDPTALLIRHIVYSKSSLTTFKFQDWYRAETKLPR